MNEYLIWYDFWDVFAVYLICILIKTFCFRNFFRISWRDQKYLWNLFCFWSQTSTVRFFLWTYFFGFFLVLNKKKLWNIIYSISAWLFAWREKSTTTFFVNEYYENRENINTIHICFAQSFDNKSINIFIDHNLMLNSILK